MPAIPLQPDELSLEDTLQAGQTFCWSFDGSERVWRGFVRGFPVALWERDGQLHFEGRGICESDVRRYFSLDLDWAAIRSTFPYDPYLCDAMGWCPGLKCVVEPWWECTANFICSSLKQIPHIRSINQTLRARFGTDGLFPEPVAIVRAGEAELRRCALGYRAKHLYGAARMLAEGGFSFDSLEHLSTENATEALSKLPGVGVKVARCVLLFAGRRHDAFPVDVWIGRVLQRLYYSRRDRVPALRELDDFSLRHFGPNRGLAQMYLFHWSRLALKK